MIPGQDVIGLLGHLGMLLAFYSGSQGGRGDDIIRYEKSLISQISILDLGSLQNFVYRLENGQGRRKMNAMIQS